MKLSIMERIQLTQILPQQGNFLTLSVAQEIKQRVALKKEELENETLDIREEGGRMLWNADADDGRDVTFSDTERAMICDELQKLDKAQKLTAAMLPVYKRFVQDKEQ